MAQRSYKRTSLLRRIQGLSAKSTALILGSVLCLGAGGALLATTSERGVEIARVQEGAATAADPEEPADGTPGDAEAKATAEDASASSAAPVRVKVHVDGAVAAPGVYELSGEDLRVTDAVEAAGGLAEGADLTNVNLAAQIVDASKVHIPYAGETTATATSAPATSSEGSASTDAGGLININGASAEELCELPGVGEATAKKIVAEREANGPFASPEDLMRVSGIGEKKFASLKDLICV